MEDKATSGYGFGPSGIGGKIGCDEGEVALTWGAGYLQHGPDIIFTR
jgi:hypothetical protein